jgi:hypothetical protein
VGDETLSCEKGKQRDKNKINQNKGEKLNENQYLKAALNHLIKTEYVPYE